MNDRPTLRDISHPDNFRVEEIADDTLIAHYYLKYWTADFMVVRGRVIRPTEVKAIALRSREGVIAALATWRIDGPIASLVTMNSFVPKKGLGTRLIREVMARARSARCRSLTVWTTNDDIASLSFFQKRGFRLRSIWPGGVDAIRELKPNIPMVGTSGIPVLDEIELEYEL